MKLVSLALFLLLSCLAAVNSHAHDDEDVSDHLSRYHRFLEVEDVYPTKTALVKVNDDDPDDQAIPCVSVPVGKGAIKLMPQAGQDRRRLLSSLSSSEQRQLQELSFVRPSAATGFYFSNEIIVEITGVDPPTASSSGTTPTIVFVGQDNSLEYSFPVTEEDMADGMVVEIVDNLREGLYTLKLIDADGTTELLVLSETIEVGPPRVPVADAFYQQGGDVMFAVGRIYYYINGNLFGCTGTVIHDNQSGRSLVLTAAACIWPSRQSPPGFTYDPIFIPNRDAVEIPANETGRDIHRSCTQDICGCWTLSGGVVHDLWKDTPWPKRLAYDYGFYVVKDYGMHEGKVCRDTTALDMAVDEMKFTVGENIVGEHSYSFGYALQWNPFFRYCADTIGIEDSTLGVDTAWINACDLGSGSTGGPWMIDFDTDRGRGKVVTVNSWYKTYTTGYGGPLIDASEARCLVNAARSVDLEALHALPEGEQGIFVNCYDRPCTASGSSGSTRKLSLRGTGAAEEERRLCNHAEEGQSAEVHKHHDKRGLVQKEADAETISFL